MALIVAACGGRAMAGSAQELIDPAPARRDRNRASGVSLDQAVEMAQRRYRARRCGPKRSDSGDRRVHQIRLLSSEGKVWTRARGRRTGAMH